MTSRSATVIAACILATATIVPAAGPRPTPPAPPARPGTVPPPTTIAPPAASASPLRPLREYRTQEGSRNNPANPLWGSAGKPFIRITTVGYTDGAASPSGTDRPNPRAISNAVCAQSASIQNRRGYTDFVWQWGQFLDHDLTETPVIDPAEPMPIAVPKGDPYFDPRGTGTATIGFTRSFHETVNGVRQQVNDLTNFIDASMVYGSDDTRARALRTLDGTGRLKTSDGNMLPLNVDGLENFPPGAAFYVAGDVRVNEQIALTSLQTLFLREHNFWADQIRKGAVNPGESSATPLGSPRPRSTAQHPPVATPPPPLDDEAIYQLARAIVGAEIQCITYREFLPVLLGPGVIPPYRGYNPKVDPRIANEFAVAGYRLGHSMLSPTLLRLDRTGKPIAAGNITLENAFFAGDEIAANGGIDTILRGLAAQRAQELDPFLIDGVRNFLFGPPGAGGFDLASLNIQRGRDHGLGSYNQVRRDLGLRPARTFADVSSNAEIRSRLASVYTSPDQMDPWVGFLSEDHIPGAIVGESLMLILADQFTALRDGDRFWYQNHLTPELQRLVEKQTLATIIRRNTTIREEIQDNVFLVRPR